MHLDIFKGCAVSSVQDITATLIFHFSVDFHGTATLIWRKRPEQTITVFVFLFFSDFVRHLEILIYPE